MNTSIAKEVTVSVEMNLNELAALLGMLAQWTHDIAEKLPSGMTCDQSMIIDELRMAFDKGKL